MENDTHLILCSNRWFSAISDYSLQLLLFLRTAQRKPIFVSQKDSILAKKCAANNFRCEEMPLWPPKLFSWFAAFRILSALISKHKPTVVWTFEGREHTLCAIHKTFFARKWKNISLVRIRGQAANAKNTFFNRLVYKKLTNKIIFVAQIVQERTKIPLLTTQTFIQPYCCDIRGIHETFPHYRFLSPSGETPAVQLDFSLPSFVVLGRYDPVKGHAWLLEAFANAKFPESSLPIQVIFIGKSENVKAESLATHAQVHLAGNVISQNNRHYISSLDSKKRVFIFDEYLEEAKQIVAQASFGVIPSLGSEVICRVAVEFMQLKLPIICSTAGALPEINTPAQAEIVEIANVEALAKALEKAVCSILDAKGDFEKKKAIAYACGIEYYSLQRYKRLLNWVENKHVEFDKRIEP